MIMKNKVLNGLSILVWFSYVLLIAYQPAEAADNVISIEQTGDNLLLEFDQIGHGNKIDTVFNGVYLDTAMSQAGNHNHVLKKSQGISGDYNQVVVEQWNNSNSTDVNKIWVDVSGDGNGVDVGQGCKFYYYTSTECSRDTWEDAGHEMEINITGDSNGIRGGQKSGSANPDHNLTIDIDGNNNGVFFTQAGSGAKNLDLTIKNDNNSVSLQQHYGAHTATVELDGTQGTDLQLWQSGGPSQTFTLTQFCVTTGGCTVSVIQQ
jgi:hypothetical protein|tara:strand:- start:14 stop:802 length:789 start_codon:yes stop_codon:yes gene_type:complete